MVRQVLMRQFLVVTLEQNGTLTIMAGGDEEAYQKVEPLFEIVGKTCHLHGSAGKGQHTKWPIRS